MRWRRSILAALIAVWSAPLWAQFDCAWPHRIEISIAAASSYNDEVRIDLGPADFPTAYTMTGNGDDLRVVQSDGTTNVPFFITEWNSTARRATLFIRPGAFAAGSNTTFYILLGNGAVSAASDAPTVFPLRGLRVRSRVSAADPISAADAYNAYSSAASDVANIRRNNVFRINNQSLGGTNGNYGLCISTMLEVSPAETGLWSFRIGADFGRGGHLRVDEVDIEEAWNDDRWWALSFANTGETFDGDVALSAGWHRIEALGFEGCCDGQIEFQARSPSGVYQDLRRSNFSLRASHCANVEVTAIPVSSASCSTVLLADKAVSVLSDPASNPDPFAIPGAVVTYAISVENEGQAIAADTVEIVDAVPSELALVVSGPTAFRRVNGAPASGLTLSWLGPTSTTDDVFFSTDGVNFNYLPTPSGPNNTDPAVTHVRFELKGAMPPASTAGNPSFQIEFEAEIR